MKTNPSHQNITSTKANRRQFLAKAVSRLFAASLLGSLLLVGTSAEAASRIKKTKIENLSTSLSIQNQHKNGARIVLRGRLMYQSEKGDYRYLDKPSVPVTLKLGYQTFYTRTDNLGWATFVIDYRHHSVIPKGRFATVGWFMRFDGVANFLYWTTSPTQRFQVVN